MNKYFPHFKSIRDRLIAYFLISAFVPFLLLSGMSWYNYQKNINNNTLAYVQELLSVSSGQLDDFFYKLKHYYYSMYSTDLLSCLSALEEKSTDGVRAQMQLNEELQELQIFYNFPPAFYVTITDENGHILYHNGTLYSSDRSLRNHEEFDAFADSSRVSDIIPSYALPGNDSDPTFYLSYIQKISSPGSTDAGYFFIIDFDAAYAASLASSLILDKDSSIYLVRDNDLLYSVGSKTLSYADIQENSLSEIGSSGFITENLSSENYLIGTHQLTGFPLTLISVNRMDAVFSQTPDLSGFTMILSIFSMTISVIFALYFSSKLTRPIHTLQKIANQAAQKNLDVTIPPLTNDEIGELGVSIDHMLSHIRTLIRDKYEYQIRENELQIKTLQSQINPHFLYNTLETISSIAEEEGIDEVSDIALNLADIYRYSISSSDQPVPLSDELENLRNYLNIINIRFAERLQIEFHIDDSVLKVPIMKLTLQPIIENAIQHGLKDVRRNGKIIITTAKENSHAKIVISDNGAGIPETTLNKLNAALNSEAFSDIVQHTSHIGILNVNYRLKLRFGDQYQMHIKSSYGHGTSVVILIPLT